MTIKRIQVGPRMSQAVIHGNTVYLAGQICPADAGATTVAAQTKVILGQIDRLLAEAGTSKQNLLSANIWLQDMATFNEMNEVWTSGSCRVHAGARDRRGAARRAAVSDRDRRDRCDQLKVGNADVGAHEMIVMAARR